MFVNQIYQIHHSISQFSSNSIQIAYCGHHKIVLTPVSETTVPPHLVPDCAYVSGHDD